MKSRGDEYALACRLREAKRHRHLSESQHAELAEFERGTERAKRFRTRERMDTLMADIRALGRVPRRKKGLGDEYALANRLREAKRQGLLSESELAELAWSVCERPTVRSSPQESS